MPQRHEKHEKVRSMNDALKEHIHQALAKGIRLDGRKLDEARPITIETGVVSTAEGSARIKCGETDVIVGVKFDIGTPYPDRPDEGALMVNAELRPLSNPEFELGPPSIESIEVSRVIDRGIRESKAIDEKSLCIEPGEKVWLVNIDVVPLNYDGNLIDIGGLAAIAALRDARFPKLVEGQPDYHEHTKEGLKLRALPVPVTVVKIGEHFLIDPTQDEMGVADARLTVATLEDGTLCALQKGGDAPLITDEIDTMINLALQRAKELRKVLQG